MARVPHTDDGNIERPRGVWARPPSSMKP